MPTDGQQIILSHFCRKIDRSWNSSQMWCKNGFQEIFLYKGEKLQVDTWYMINHGAQPILARRTYSMQLTAIPWPCCCIEYTWEDGKNTWCEEYIFHSPIVALPASPFHNAVCLVQQAAQTYRMVLIRNSKWVGKSANLLLFCARVTVGPPPSKLFRHITNLNWDMDICGLNFCINFLIRV